MPTFKHLALLGPLAALVAAAPSTSSTLKSILTSYNSSWSADTTMAFPGTDEFTNVTSRWTINDEPTFSAAISPSTAQDVAAAVKLAVSQNISFLATGKRHGYTDTLGQCQDGLAIDLSNFDSFEVDKATDTFTIGGSASVGDFQDALFDAGYLVQCGSASCPGFVGLGVGGGIGRFVGKFGLVQDALVSATMVTADGQVLVVSEDENADLFWGIRGAGANLGIILFATFRGQKISENNDGMVLTADIYFQPSHTAKYFEYMASLDLPGNVGGINLLGYNDTTDSMQVLANWIWFGPEKQGREFMQRFIDLGASSASMKYVAWNKLVDTAAGGFGASAVCDKGVFRSFYSANVRTMSGETYQQSFEAITAYFDAFPDARSASYLNIEIFPNQAMLGKGKNSTAYPWRDTIGYLQFGIELANETASATTLAAGERLGAALRDSWVKTSGYSDLSVYVNYARGDETAAQRYGSDKLPHLVALKSQWDPNNVFRFSNGLPTTYEL